MPRGKYLDNGSENVSVDAGFFFAGDTRTTSIIAHNVEKLRVGTMPDFDRYIIMRDLSDIVESSPNIVFRGPGGRTNILATTAKDRRQRPQKKLKVDFVSLTSAEARDARRDGKTRAVAKQIPLRLIRPVGVKASRSRGLGQAAWGIAAVGADRSRFTGKGVVVAVLDTGIDRNHEAFVGVDIVEQDFTNEGNGDSDGHGTHCAGTIFGRNAGGQRIGVAPGVERALIGKVIGETGGDSGMLFRAMQWAIQSGCDVISMSLGFDFPGYVQHLVKDEDWPVDLATSEALVAYRDNLRMFDNLAEQVRLMANFNTGAVVVAAAGNESRGDEREDYRVAASLPAAANGVFSVGALQKTGAKYSVASFSNSLPRVSAPGVGIASAKAGTKAALAVMDGTSMACPHVAGVAALWWEALREANGGDTQASLVEAKLLGTARSNVFSASTRPLDRGNGLISAP